MSRIIITEKAIQGLERCKSFLKTHSKIAERRAAKIISQKFSLLERYPDIGRPHVDIPELRELIIEFGATGYIALYRYILEEDIVYILAFRHQKEAGY